MLRLGSWFRPVGVSPTRVSAGAPGSRPRLVVLGAVPQQEIPGLFAGADAIAYVSLYETFGHPVLEAFAFGKPLVTSATSATAEIAGDAARLIDPESVDSIADGLRDVLVDGALRDRLAAASPRRVAAFTWERCAEGTLGAISLARRRGAPGRAADTAVVQEPPA